MTYNIADDAPDNLVPDPIDTDEEDWLRSMKWNLWTTGDAPHLVHTVDELRTALGDDDAIRSFCDSPAAEPMPPNLRAELVSAGFEPRAA